MRTDSHTETSTRFFAGRNSFISWPPVIMGGNLNQQHISNNPLECGTAFGIPRIYQRPNRDRYYLLPSVEPILDNGAMRFGCRAALPSRNEATVSAAAEGQPIPFDSIENEFIKKAVEIVSSQIG